MSYTEIDNYLWNVKRYLMRKYGCDQAERDIFPLSFWIRTGRASAEYINKLLEKKFYVVGRMLHTEEPQTDEEVIKSIKAYLDK